LQKAYATSAALGNFWMDEEWRKCEEDRQRLHELSTKVVKVIKCGKVTIDKKACKEYLNKLNK